MKIIHLSAECYPAAKVGGLADVVGALPKYLQQRGVDASVIMPGYNTHWINDREFTSVFEGEVRLGDRAIGFRILHKVKDSLGFPLFIVDIPTYFNRAGIYGDPQTGHGYRDEAERFITFQRATLQWIASLQHCPDIIHCHDHHTGLVPFMMTQCEIFESLSSIPTVLTVHNAEYQGIYFHDKQSLLPAFNESKTGLLDWDGMLNSLAAGLKCCWQISTVSPSYMDELQKESNGLEWLFAGEAQKSLGILNGIDTEVWNPQADPYLDYQYDKADARAGKKKNKKILCGQFGLSEDRPLISFIGRLVGEKGADLLPDLFKAVLQRTKDVSFLVLGTGNPELHKRFNELSDKYVGFFDASLNYNEQLAHQIYAGSDFMIIPSRVEPCGLNQMYAMRYGTIPIVRETGGLKDTVRDISHPNGHGITFNEFSLQAGKQAISRVLSLYDNPQKFQKLRFKNMNSDYSWNVSAETYISMYNKLIN